MAVADITKPIALDETLQATNTALGNLNTALGTLNTTEGSQAKDATLSAVNTALGSINTALGQIKSAIDSMSASNIGNMSALTTTDKTSLVGAVNELVSGKISKSQTAGLVKNDGSIDTENYSDEIDAIVNVYGGKNLWDIERWLSNINIPFTKSGNIYTITINSVAAYDNPYTFSDVDMPITVSALGFVANMGIGIIEIFNSSNVKVGQISNSDITPVTCTGCKVKIECNDTGTVILTAPMIRDARISDPTYVPYAMTNRELTEKIENKGGNIVAIGSVPYYPPHNGIAVLHMVANQSQAGNHTLFLNKDSNRIATIASYITGWGAVDISFPMVKGSEYTVEQESGDPANVDWTHSYLYY